ncbi:LysR family transcriptional regulator [Sulfitobacter sp. S190]|uniref:LysR family transcriptional regulator n=1 Tax=Sulfitobacter sp. S190 TaxID=2867022 RepID=UPI0021A3C98E|nr:LysR family transcriptional regulator [Sulfitobacter sp. S190]UWR23441.1 LysR family transcriptional regulator [Sulfitobacter sp. S190]
MDGLNGLAEFCAVVDHGGFTRAAEALGVSPSFVSRRVSDLEARLGVRLLHRTTRQVNLTDMGAQYHERASAVLNDIRDMEADLAERQNRIAGRIRISAGGLFGETHVAKALAAFAAEHPAVEIELDVSARRIDLIREGFDLAVRHGMPDDPDLVVRRIASRRMIVCAAPGYVTAHGAPDTPGDLSAHFCLSATRDWAFVHNGQPLSLRVQSRWACNNGVALAAAARAGLGITRLADTYVTADLDAGTLVPLLQDYEVALQPTVLVYPSRDNMPVRLRTLIGYLAKTLGQTDQPQKPHPGD